MPSPRRSIADDFDPEALEESVETPGGFTRVSRAKYDESMNRHVSHERSKKTCGSHSSLMFTYVHMVLCCLFLLLV